METCSKCGKEFNSLNTVYSNSPRFKETKWLPLCKICLDNEFNIIRNNVGGSHKVALFYFCIAFDVPYIKEMAEKTSENEGYLSRYLGKVRSASSASDKKCFFDGDVVKFENVANNNIVDFKNKKMEEDTQKRNYTTKELKELRKIWGDEDLTQFESERLEELYEMKAKDLKFIEDTEILAIRHWCQCILGYEKSLKIKDYKSAKECHDMADKALASEKLRKSDENPIELDRLSGLVDYLEKKIFGAIPNIPELLTFLFEKLPQLYGYKITTDAADVVYNNLENHYFIHDGQEKRFELPTELKIKDNLSEFVPIEQQPKWEKQALKLIREYERYGTFDGMEITTDFIDEIEDEETGEDEE